MSVQKNWHHHVAMLPGWTRRSWRSGRWWCSRSPRTARRAWSGWTNWFKGREGTENPTCGVRSTLPFLILHLTGLTLTFTASVVEGLQWKSSSHVFLRSPFFPFRWLVWLSWKVPGPWFTFAVFSQGDACTSCSSAGTVVGDGVVVPGPKGERGEPGPQGEGKPGKNVRGLCFCLFISSPLPLCTMRITDDHRTCFLSRENQAYQVFRGPWVPREARYGCPFIVLSDL